MQKEIEPNKAAKHNHPTALPDETQPPNKNNKLAKPSVPTSAPTETLIQEAMNSSKNNKLPEATQNVLPDITDKDIALPDNTYTNAAKPGKPIKGVLKTKQISIQRSKDP